MAKHGVPLDVVDAAVQVAGHAYFYKDELRRLFKKCGIPDGLYERFKHEAKFVIARNIFAELEAQGEIGTTLLIRVVREMCTIRKIVNDKVNQRVALNAIETLRELAKSALIESAEEENERTQRVQKAQLVAERKW